MCTQFVVFTSMSSKSTIDEAKSDTKPQRDDESASAEDFNQPLDAIPLLEAKEKKFLCHVCSKSFLHKHHLILHLRIHTNEKEYECTVCARKFRQKSHLNQHNKMHTGQKDFSCEFCAKLFLHRGDLRRHLNTHRAQLPFHCAHCAHRFSDWITKQTHETTCTSRRYKCSICAFESIDNADLEAHKSTHIGERRFTCDICSKAFRMKHHITVHMKTHIKAKRRKKPFRCDVCAKCFSMKHTLTTHMKFHAADRPFGCAQCPKRFVHRSDLNRHLKSHQNKKKTHSINNDAIKTKTDLKCELEGQQEITANFYQVLMKEEEFTESDIEAPHWDNGAAEDGSNDGSYELELKYSPETAQLQRPVIENTVSSENTFPKSGAPSSEVFPVQKVECVIENQNIDPQRPFICDICSKGFRLKHHLVVHLKTHTSEKNYQCEVCSKTFAQSSHLNIHLKVHSGEKAFPCNYCTKRFLHRGDVHRHLLTHRELPFTCATCKRPFSDEHSKSLHELSCTARIHKCTLCEYETTISGRLKTHMIVHSGVREFICEICPKSFAYKHNLLNHRKTHSNERSHKCGFCPRIFRLSVHLQRHLKRKHKK